MIHRTIKRALSITVLTAALLMGANRPFPQALDFPGCIKPNDLEQSDMNASVTSLYESYRNKYLKAYGTDQYYIEATGNGDGGESSLTISEAHGYGMIIFALMAGHEENAQKYFDGMFRFFKDWESSYNDYLMSWIAGEVAHTNSATDGDMDIAYALLLADKQWGSDGTINYIEEARTIITLGIQESDMSYYTKRILLGDWDGDHYTTRSSDWMTGHLHAFEVATEDPFWGEAADTVYSLIERLTFEYAPNTGLLPDFIAGEEPYPDETGGGTYEDKADQYYYNACRVPWRIALDYAHYGTTAAKTTTTKILSWLRTETEEDPGKIMNGYTLAGEVFGTGYDIVYAAPFAAGAITDSSNQEYLNGLWQLIKDDEGYNEYAHALNLLSTLLITGNWWDPSHVKYVEPSRVTMTNLAVMAQCDAGTFLGKLGCNGTGKPFNYELAAGDADFAISNDSVFTKRPFDATDSSLVLTVEVTDRINNSAAGAFTVEVHDEASNIVPSFPWEIELDDLGTTAIDTGSSILADSVLTVTFSMGESYGSAHVFGSVFASDLNGTIIPDGSIALTYRSSERFSLELRMNSVHDFAFHATELPSTEGAWKDTVLSVHDSVFVQPENWGERVEFNSSDVEAVAFTALFEGTQGSLEVQELLIDGLIPFQASSVTVPSPKPVQMERTVAWVTQEKLNLNVPSTGRYDISIYSLKGQKLFSLTKELSAGTSSVPLEGMAAASQMVIIHVNHDSERSVFKSFLR